MKRKPTRDLRFKKNIVSNLNEVKAGGPPPPPGSNSCVQEQTCVTCKDLACN
ncbi:hypothetical protein U8527_04475 [Kordia algicida OT-1]|uniref:hypothetical protein n=1 Tax=Kordia algicida TaxID=221066 RepID=UPI0012FAD100|nr:hypothetical protein [Kordia algicida]